MFKQQQDCYHDKAQWIYGVLATSQAKASRDHYRVQKVLVYAKTPVPYAQCRTQVDGSWAADPSWQCQQPGGSPTGNLPSSDKTPSQPFTSFQPTTGNTNSKMAAGNGQVAPVKIAAASIPAPGASNPLTSGGGNTSPVSGGSQAATVGYCDSTSAPGGWDGVASTSYYGWMGSACDCGQTSWQWTHSPGIYNAAVNQKLFQGALNSAGQPNCGSACGTCYELSTSGFNTYDGGVASGSTLTVQIVDACFSNGDHWCGSTSDGFKDSSDCSVHFDIQTGSPGTDGQAAIGSDGTTWNDGGQIVYYRPTACPQTLTSNYKSSCKC